MKKVLFVSLLLMSIFLVGSQEVFADNGCTFYSCEGRVSCGEGIEEEWTECVDIHVSGNGYAELYGAWFHCELGGIGVGSSNKSFIGACESSEGLLGIQVSLS